jgi:hypothetical protein
MREFEQKQKIRKRIYSKFTIVILLIILFFVFKGTFEIWQKERQSKATLKVEEERFYELEKRKELLNSKIEYIDSEVGKEELVREKFNVAKEGEKEVFIINEEEKTEIEPEPSKLGKFWHNLIGLIGF